MIVFLIKIKTVPPSARVEVLSNLGPVQRRAFFVAFCLKSSHIQVLPLTALSLGTVR